VPVFLDHPSFTLPLDEVYRPSNCVFLPTTWNLYCSEQSFDDSSSVSTKANVTHSHFYSSLSAKTSITQNQTLNFSSRDRRGLDTRRNLCLSAMRLKNETKLSTVRLKPAPSTWTSSSQSRKVEDKTLGQLAKQKSYSDVSVGCSDVVISDVKRRLAEMLGKTTGEGVKLRGFSLLASCYDLPLHCFFFHLLFRDTSSSC